MRISWNRYDSVGRALIPYEKGHGPLAVPHNSID